MTEEQYYLVDLECTRDKKFDGDGLTHSLIKFLKHKGLKVIRAEAPVVVYEHKVYEMRTRKLTMDTTISESFNEIYEYFVETGAEEIIIFNIRIRYRFDDEENVLMEYKTFRFGVVE